MFRSPDAPHFEAVSRDGTGHGANVDDTAALARAISMPILASGGVSSLADLHALAQIPGGTFADRLILGSTYYSSPPSYARNHALELLLAAGLSQPDLEKILSGNVRRLFKLPEPAPA